MRKRKPSVTVVSLSNKIATQRTYFSVYFKKIQQLTHWITSSFWRLSLSRDAVFEPRVVSNHFPLTYKYNLSIDLYLFSSSGLRSEPPGAVIRVYVLIVFFCCCCAADRKAVTLNIWINRASVPNTTQQKKRWESASCWPPFVFYGRSGGWATWRHPVALESTSLCIERDRQPADELKRQWLMPRIKFEKSLEIRDRPTDIICWAKWERHLCYLTRVGAYCVLTICVFSSSTRRVFEQRKEKIPSLQWVTISHRVDVFIQMR